MQPLRALAFSCAIYLLWQGQFSLSPQAHFAYGSFKALYWKFVYVDRKEKVESGERTTSLSFLLADQRGAIGKALASVPPERRVLYFMLSQFCVSAFIQLSVI